MGVRKGGVVGIKEGGAREGEGREGDTQSITNRSSRVYPTFLVVTVSVSKVGRVVRLRRHASLFPSYPSPSFPSLSLSLFFPLQLFNYPSMPKDSSAWLFTANVPFESFLLVGEEETWARMGNGDNRIEFILSSDFSFLSSIIHVHIGQADPIIRFGEGNWRLTTIIVTPPVRFALEQEI